jgi:23S rRNA pseudouridine1911/1915/1917 synthase
VPDYIDPIKNVPAEPERSPLSANVPDAMIGHRFDRALVALFPDFTRARLQAWLEAGRITLDGLPALKANTKVKPGQSIEVRPEAPPHMLAMRPEPVSLTIVYEDDACLVLDKPAGMVVHPAAGNWSGTLLNGLLHHHAALANLPRAGIVHRLDKDTSGLMVSSKTAEAQTCLIAQLQARSVRRIYCAVVWGRVQRAVTVEGKIGRDPRSRLKMAVVSHGKPATTHFLPIAQGLFDRVPVSLLACKLETGRTHQIRVHAAHAGFGLLGDVTYRQARTPAIDFPRQALHAAQLAFEAPLRPGDGRLSFFAPPPADLLALLASLEIAVDWPAFLAMTSEHWPDMGAGSASDDALDDVFDDEL